jgi:hypothetical protein
MSSVGSAFFSSVSRRNITVVNRFAPPLCSFQEALPSLLMSLPSRIRAHAPHQLQDRRGVLRVLHSHDLAEQVGGSVGAHHDILG